MLGCLEQAQPAAARCRGQTQRDAASTDVPFKLALCPVSQGLLTDCVRLFADVSGRINGVNMAWGPCAFGVGKHVLSVPRQQHGQPAERRWWCCRWQQQ